MIVPSTCNGFRGIGLMDYAYLALNVYHDHKDDGWLGHRPRQFFRMDYLVDAIESGQKGWFQIFFPGIRYAKTDGFYAEFYVKVYKHKIQHLMVSFRGTANLKNDVEDVVTWGSDFLPTALKKDLERLPSYWNQAVGFLMRCQRIIRELDQHGLLTHVCGHHVTGHSLGGALANLTAGTACIMKPTQMNATLPITPDVISFNAPGIGDMPHVINSAFHEDQVVSMRATYDVVSAIGKPYGYVINNTIPEGYQTMQKAFADEALKSAAERDGMKSLYKLNVERYMIDRAIASTATVDEIINGKHLLSQHSMSNFLKALATHSSSIATSFQPLLHWGMEHGGLNHNLQAKALWSGAKVVV